MPARISGAALRRAGFNPVQNWIPLIVAVAADDGLFGPAGLITVPGFFRA